MHGLRHDLKTYVVTQNPKTIEHLKQIAILPEKAQPNQVNTLETYGNLLQEIQQIKAKIESKTEQVHNIRHMTEHLNQVRINTRRPIDSNEAMPQYFYRPRMQNTYSRFQGPRPRYQYSQSRCNRAQPLGQASTYNTFQPSSRVKVPVCSYSLGQCVDRNRCPAKAAVCHNCKKLGHCSRACRLTRLSNQ